MNAQSCSNKFDLQKKIVCHSHRLWSPALHQHTTLAYLFFKAFLYYHIVQFLLLLDMCHSNYCNAIILNHMSLFIQIYLTMSSFVKHIDKRLCQGVMILCILLHLCVTPNSMLQIIVV